MVRTAGIISRIQKIMTKTGQQMLFAKIEDFSPQPLEVVVFNSTLMKTAPIWEVNNAVLVEGRMSWRDNEPKIICEAARKLTA
jgi:DNA polymerase III alpha subunit